MNPELLRMFLSEDADTLVRAKLLDAIRAQRTAGTSMVRDFAFNRFKVTLDFERKLVCLQDELTVGPQGEHQLTLGNFESALSNTQ